MEDYNDRLAFWAQWFDAEIAFTKNFLLFYYPFDNTIGLYDTNLNRVYLRRTICDGITRSDIYVGNTLCIYGKQIILTEIADEHTRRIIGKFKEHTFTMLKPGVVDKLGEIICQFEERQFQIVRMRMCRLSRREALEFYEFRKGNPFLPFILEHAVSGQVVAIELVGDDAIKKLRRELGPEDPIIAREVAPNTLRAIYGHERASNGFHSSANPTEVSVDASYFFPQSRDRKPPETTVQLNNSTLCVIKPHAIKEGKLGHILKEINESHFDITAMQMFHLSNAEADEFLEVYKGVVCDFNALLSSFLNGPCVALEISAHNHDVNVYEEFRNFVGPSDPNIARKIRPKTLRAKFGIDKYRNAVHCTDVADDTVLELEYFFKIIN